jgi:hypothetical protein
VPRRWLAKACKSCASNLVQCWTTNDVDHDPRRDEHSYNGTERHNRIRLVEQHQPELPKIKPIAPKMGATCTRFNRQRILDHAPFLILPMRPTSTMGASNNIGTLSIMALVRRNTEGR